MGRLYNAKRCIYKGYKLASTYELRAAIILEKALKNSDIKSWDYPKYQVIKYKNKIGKERKYIIDFIYIDNKNNEIILEVKGRQVENDLYKWRAALDQGYNLIVWKLKDIEEKEKKYKIKKSEINKSILQCIENHNIQVKKKLLKQIELEKYKEINPKCLYCGNQITPRQINQKFCCKKHNNLYKQMQYQKKNNIAICPCCKKEFIRKHGKQNYCCEEHRILYYEKLALESKTINCLYCKKLFIKEKNLQKYCCDAHRKLYYKQIKPKKDYYCLYCNNKFERNSTHQKYCCKNHKILHYKQLKNKDD